MDVDGNIGNYDYCIDTSHVQFFNISESAIGIMHVDNEQLPTG